MKKYREALKTHPECSATDRLRASQSKSFSGDAGSIGEWLRLGVSIKYPSPLSQKQKKPLFVEEKHHYNIL